MVVVVLEEREIRCPDCQSLLSYTMKDVRELWRTDYQGGREKLGDGIVCIVCQELIVTEPKERSI